MVKITFITGNIGKFNECREILHETLGNEDFELVRDNRDLPEIQAPPEECAKNKCEIVSRYIGGPVLIEDVSLFFSAWGTLPGPYVKWFTNGPGVEAMVKMLSPFDDKSAEAWCIYAYYDIHDENLEPILFIGKNFGTIVSPRGDNGFGFDSIFQPDGEDRTLAEMDAEYKNKISHRRSALEQFSKYVKDKLL